MQRKKYVYAIDDDVPVRMDRDSDGLMCPLCGGAYLHQLECRATWRREDADGVCHTSSLRKEAKEQVPSADIPSRRDIIEIDFDCEICAEKSTMYIQQHKGVTYMGWYK